MTLFNRDWTERCHLFAAAGLVHDIGKIGEPARVALSPSTQRLEQIICPTDRSGRSSHRHVLYTAEALETTGCEFRGLDRDALIRIANNHHRPSGGQFDEHLLTKADWLASGHDRREVGEDDGSAEAQPDRITGLSPVFVSVAGTLSPGSHRTLPTASLTEASLVQLLPIDAPPMEQYRHACERLWSELLQSLRGRVFESPSCTVDGLLGVLESFGSLVPSSRSRTHIPDVSLFDHSRTVAAIASCLSVLHASGQADAHAIRGRYRMLALKFGGIQGFISRSVPAIDGTGAGAKGRARLLRARSFYIGLLAHLAARRVIDHCGLPLVHLVFEAGGHARLLLPDHPEVVALAREACITSCRWVHEHLGGSVRLDWALCEAFDDGALALQGTPVADGFADQYRSLVHALSCARGQGLADVLRDEGPAWRATGWVGPRPSNPADRGELLESLATLGRELPKSDAVVIAAEGAAADRDLRWTGDMLGYSIGVLRKGHAAPASSRLARLHPDARQEVNAATLLAASHIPIATRDDVARLSRLRTGDVPGTGEEDATEEGAPLKLDDIAALGSRARGDASGSVMLGAMKADLDRLGLLMAYPFPHERNSKADAPPLSRASLGRYAALSRSIDLFFKGFLDARIASEHRLVYTVFAGGDDLFVIGPWADIVELAAKLRRWLREYALGHDRVSISAGVAFTKPRVPIRALTEGAAEALERSKAAGRDRITVGARTVGWDGLERALEWRDALLEAATDESTRLPSSMLYRLMGYARMGERTMVNAKPDRRRTLGDFKWRAQMNYDLRRNLPQRSDGERPTTQRVREMALTVRSGEDCRVLALACTLALYSIRGERS